MTAPPQTVWVPDPARARGSGGPGGPSALAMPCRAPDAVDMALTYRPADERTPTPPGHGGGTPRAGLRRLSSLVRKEFIEIRRDRRTLALIVGVPLLLLVIFGYAANFAVQHIATELVGHDSAAVRDALEADGHFTVRDRVAPDVAAAQSAMQHGQVAVAIVLDARGEPTEVYVDGSNLLIATTAERELTALQQGTGSGPHVRVIVLYNPTLSSTNFMIPGLIGIIMTQVALVLTALGVVRERERGTIEQLMITPVTKIELMVGKTIPYLVIALFDLVFVLLVSALLFDVHVRGDVALLFGEAFLFLTATLGMGLLISTLARTQLQATQMSVFVQLPQMLLSGLIFPLAAMPWGVRWISYVLPLTYFASVARGVMLKGVGITDLWTETIGLAVLAVAYVGLAVVRFRKTLD
jgi:ABC-2 type transport system permease protein